MRLSLLSTTAVLCAHHDDAADILFLELQGHLTLAKAQAAGAQVVRLALPRHYTRVIVSTCQLSTLEPAALYWLRQVLASGLRLLGVRKLAWVCQNAPAGLALMHSLLAGLPVVATLFNDLEHAVNWLPNCSGESAQQGLPAPLAGTALAASSPHAPAMGAQAGRLQPSCYQPVSTSLTASTHSLAPHCCISQSLFSQAAATAPASD